MQSSSTADLQNRMNRMRRILFLLFFLLAVLLIVSGYFIYHADGLFADLNFIRVVITGYVITLLLLLACGVGFFYKHVSKRILQERFTMETERAELLARSHVTLHSIGDAVITTNRSGQVTQMNPTAENLTGWREADALNKPLAEVFHIINETTREPVENPVSRVLQEGIAIRLANHTLLISKDGAERPIADSAAPVRGLSGRNSGDDILGVVLVFRDQTEERQAQGTIQREKDNLQAILAASPVCMLLLDETGKIIFVNPAGQRLSGRTAKQIAGSACGDFMCCVNRLEENLSCGGSSQCPSCSLLTAIRHHFATGDSIADQEIEITMDAAHDDTSRWYQFSIKPVIINNQRLAILTLYDISDLKSALKSLRESIEQHRSLVAGLPDIVLRFDRNGRHLFVSDNVTGVVDIQPAQFIGKTHRELGFPEAYCQFWEAAINEVFNTEKPFETEFTFESSKGRVIFNRRLLPERDAKGAICSVLSLSRDITHTRQTGEENINLATQLEQAQKMEPIGRLAGGVAHDFNNMLGVISCHSEMILDDMEPSHPLHASMLAIQEATKRSASVVRQLLTFARKQSVNPRILDINNSISSMLKLLKRIIGENIELLWEPAPEIWNVNMDPSQIDQMLANLLVNAKDAIVSVGTITIKTEKITLDDFYCAAHAGAYPGEYVMVSVIDTGTGMEKNIVDHIFEPFFTTKPSDKGTGLGLATVYGVVKQNNGYIDVKSEPGCGTTFMLYFPRAKDKIIFRTETTTGEEKQKGSETLLLVDDEEEILKSTALFLKRYGYEVLSAARPGEAIQIKKEFPGRIDLLITDVVMPEMNGRELCEVLRKDDPGLKCLYLSGYAEEIIASQGLTSGSVHLLQKPFSMKQLTRKIRELVGG